MEINNEEIKGIATMQRVFVESRWSINCDIKDWEILGYNIFLVKCYLDKNSMTEKSVMEGNSTYLEIISDVLRSLFIRETRNRKPYTKLQTPNSFVKYVIPELEKKYLEEIKLVCGFSAKETAKSNVAQKIYEIIHEENS